MFYILHTILTPDCKVCCGLCMQKMFPAHFCIVRAIYITYILSAQYFARNSICRIEKHSKCRMAMCFKCKRQCAQPEEHSLGIFCSAHRNFVMRRLRFCYLCQHINIFCVDIGALCVHCVPSALCKLCNQLTFHRVIRK